MARARLTGSIGAAAGCDPISPALELSPQLEVTPSQQLCSDHISPSQELSPQLEKTPSHRRWSCTYSLK
ncbi:hypothetical protein NDU88_004086 [Pleurodeles waltl]|uniref:Uncharacterized protein n=1 Tax=Pleurodeles waltl TaxID=8319 RepID=A0AAV7V0B6_PLEWA|nr:hypothetical protein NDU88_004086 [Pleurodeles waltl]